MNQINDSDTELMLRFQNGDSVSFDTLLEKYQKPIINTIYRIINDRITAEDLAQEVFLKVYKAKDTYQPKAKFSSWIYKIATNLALNELRYQRRHRAESLDATLQGEDEELPRQVADTTVPNALESLHRQELQEKIKVALDSLPEKQKMVVVLAKFQGLPQKEIAQILGCSIMAVKLHLHRARMALKDKLAAYLKE